MTDTTAPPVGLALRSLLRADTIALLRNGRALVLSFVLPIALVLITGARARGSTTALDPAYTIGLSITYGLMAAGMLGYPIAMARDREAGVFQRMRVTPAPAWTFPVSRLLVQFVVAPVMAVVVLAIGGARHHLTLDAANWLAVIGISLLGAAMFLAIGQAIVGLTATSGEVNAVGRVLFVIFIVIGLIGAAGLLGDTIRTIAGWTPVGALTNLYSAAAGTVSWGRDQWIGLAMAIVYAVVCGVIGVRWFRWTVR